MNTKNTSEWTKTKIVLLSLILGLIVLYIKIVLIIMITCGLMAASINY
nr:MAG TPA: hypothetical protein [Microviridae sp.]